jgi:DNA-binding response OmpR family regulator
MKKIMIIEPDLNISLIFAGQLRNCGYNVLTEINFWSGFNKMNSFDPDILICNNSTPQLRGKEIIKLLRGTTKHQNLPVIFLSSRLNTGNLSEIFINISTSTFFSKPFNVSELLMRIEIYSILNKYKDKLIELDDEWLYSDEITTSKNSYLSCNQIFNKNIDKYNPLFKDYFMFCAMK